MNISSKFIFRKVSEILIFRAKNGLGTITYKCLAKLVGLNTNCFFMKWLDPIIKALSELDRLSTREGTPRLSALVVSASTEIPGQGYWGVVESPIKPLRSKLHLQIHASDVAALLQYFSESNRIRA